MQLSNFNILKNRWPELAELGANAEEYAYSDPQSAMLKLRCFAELIVNNIYQDFNLNYDNNWDLFDKLKGKEFNKIISRPILDKFHAIRIKANKAIHKNEIASDAVWLIREAYCVACWIYTSYKEGTSESCNEFAEPINSGNKIDKLNETIRELENILKTEKQKSTFTPHQNNEAINTFAHTNKSIAKKMNLNSNEIYKRVNINDIFSNYKLTNEQSNLVDNLNTFIENESQQVFLLKGYAGTGKTFITKGLTEYLTSIGREFILAAPTGKAAKVIKEKTLQEAYTIHKAIYSYDKLKEYKVENEDGSETFKFYFELAENHNSSNTIYIIDEASMISNIKQEGEFFRFGSGYLLQDLLEFINIDHNDHNKKIIFIGDDAQLPPIGMNYSPALSNEYLQKEYGLHTSNYKLTEVVRQKKNSGILFNAMILRDSIKNNIFNKLQFNLNYNDIDSIDYQELLEKYLQSCNYKINGESIIISYTNKMVNSYNQIVRKYFFPNQQYICAGDKVMALQNNNTFGLFIYNGDFGLVRKVESQYERRDVILKVKINNEMKILNVPLQFRKIEVGFKQEDGKAYFFECLIFENKLYPDLVYKDSQFLTYKNEDLESIEMKALYVDFVNRAKEQGLKQKSEEFKLALKTDKYFNSLKVKFGYALTCHKAQGSEWNNVFIDCKSNTSQLLNKNYFRWLYTAITRTSKKVYLLDEPNIEITDTLDISNIHMEHIQGTSLNIPPKEKVVISDNNPFNIEDKFLLAIYKKVIHLIYSNNITILDLQHNQNQEQYTFESNNEYSRVTIYYNARDIITSITPIETNNLSNLLKVILEPLKNHLLVVEKHTNFTFNENFLEDFYLVLKEKLNNNIIIANIDHLNYMERYSFIRNEEIAIIDFYYNGKGQFKSPTPNNRSNSKQLVQDILGTI